MSDDQVECPNDLAWHNLVDHSGHARLWHSLPGDIHDEKAREEAVIAEREPVPVGRSHEDAHQREELDLTAGLITIQHPDHDVVLEPDLHSHVPITSALGW